MNNNLIRRIFVEKKEENKVEEIGLLTQLKNNLNIKTIKAVRILNRYDMSNIDDESYGKARDNIFSETPVDIVYEEIMPKEIQEKKNEDGSWTNFLVAVEYLPGQYDQRADSAMQCIRLINPAAMPIVKFAKVIFVEGVITKAQGEAIEGFLINPVDSQKAAMEKPETLEMEVVVPEDVKVWEGFLEKTDEGLDGFRKEQGFAMSLADLKHIRKYYKEEENRNPTDTELRVIDTYWSDHCRHTTFNAELSGIFFDESPYGQLVKESFDEYLQVRSKMYIEKKKPVSLMDMATIGAKYLKKEEIVTDIDESEEINACSIKVKAKIDGKEEDWLVMFKNETHNHPTEIEPFGGAATCLGGAIRDPLSGRSYVYQAMRVTGAGDPRTPLGKTLPGKLPQSKITKEAAKGYSSYGNQIGLATGLVDEIYHEGYVAKRMEVGAVIAAAPAENVVRTRPETGDLVVLLGGRTGRDGVGGATGSSKEHTEGSITDCSAEVQKGNPPVERNIQRMFRRKEVATLIKRCNDFGAGGVSVAVGELADSLHIYLDQVPKKYDGLDGTELAISESQERMAVVINKENRDLIFKYADEENVEATVVAEITDTGRMVMEWRGKEIFNISRNFLDTNGASQDSIVKVKQPVKYENERKINSIEEALEDLNCCSKKGLIENFDSTIGAGTVLMPLGGKTQLTPALGMAAKLPVVEGNTETATLMTYGFDPMISEASPFHGAYYAVIDSITKIVGLGGRVEDARLSFQNYFEKLGENPEKWAKPMAALLGALKVQLALGTPAIGGKDSMSGTFNEINVPPTLISFAVATTDADNIISPEFKKAGNHIVIVEPKKLENNLLDLENYKFLMAKVTNLIQEGKVLASNTISHGGLFMSVGKMAAGNKVGAQIIGLSEEKLLASAYGSLILEIDGNLELTELFEGVPYMPIGKTIGSENIIIQQGAGERKISLKDFVKKWTSPLEKIFPTKTEELKEEMKAIKPVEKAALTAAIKVAKPKVIIPAFPGTNCEMDSKRAFEAAGAQASIEIIRNLSEDALNQSIESLAKGIRESQIIMLPGGFSGGDEPDGSAKFITAIFRNPLIKEATTDLLDRGGLMLGICNGFQALIKLGLVPEGKIVDQGENSPTLTYNKIGRHVSSLVRTSIVNNHSPWLRGTEVGDIHTVAVSHGEGRFVANDKVVKELIAKGQIATRYVDLQGKPSMDMEINPNYSVMGIEGITSEDGRILGKMAHSERIGKNVYKNVIGNYDQQIFKSGVDFLRK